MMTDKAISFIRYDKDNRITEIFTDADPAVVQAVYDALESDPSHTFASGTFNGVRVRFAHIYKKCEVSNYLNNNTTKIRKSSPAAADNSEFGSGDQPTILSSRQVDLADVSDVVDEAAIGLAITATVAPSSPQHELTVGSLPTLDVRDFMGLWTFGGINNGAAPVTLDGQMTLNGTDVGNPLTQLVVAPGEYFCYGFQYAGAALVEGDVLGIKLWADISGDVELDYGTFYIMPRVWNKLNAIVTIPNQGAGVFQNHYTGDLTGAVPGVTYSALLMNAGAMIISFDDQARQINVNGFLTTLDTMLAFWVPSGAGVLEHSEFNAIADPTSTLFSFEQLLRAFIVQT